MTLKEAVIKSLGELNKPSIYIDIYSHIEQNKYFDFSNLNPSLLQVA